jgi:hypothetical protein
VHPDAFDPGIMTPVSSAPATRPARRSSSRSTSPASTSPWPGTGGTSPRTRRYASTWRMTPTNAATTR